MNYIEFTNDTDSINDKLLHHEELKDKDLKRIYKYFTHKGYRNILFLEAINLGSTLFMIFFILILVNCIDYQGLGEINKYDNYYLWDYIQVNQMINNSFLGISCVIIFGLYIIIRLVTLLDESQKYYKIKLFFKEKLDLDTYEIQNIEWEEIAQKIESNYGINVYQITSRILRKENLMIPIFDSKINHLIVSKLMEWNLIFSIFNTVLTYFNTDDIAIQNSMKDENESEEEEEFLISDLEKIKQQQIYFRDRRTIKNKCQSKLITLSVLTYICMPFLFIYILFFTFLKYGERYYHKPAKITYRQWSLNSYWKMRYFNELEHNFEMRMDISSKYAKEYLDYFKSIIFTTVIKFIVFMSSSFFITLIILSIYNENLLLNLNISKNKHVLWYLGIFASIIAIGRSILKNKKIKTQDKNISYKKLLIYNPFLHSPSFMIAHQTNKKYEDYKKKNLIQQYYTYQISTLLRECFSVLLVPFYLIYICNYLDSILDRIEENLYYDENLGFISHQSNFRNTNKNSSYKTLHSFKDFRTKYPRWGTNIEIYQLGDISILKNPTSVFPKHRNNYTESIFGKTLESEISII